MILAGNFDEHKFVDIDLPELAEMGFHIGAVVALKRRITVTYNVDAADGSEFRKDIAKDTELSIKGFADDKPVLAVDNTVNGKFVSVDITQPITNLIPVKLQKTKCSDPSSGSASVYKGNPQWKCALPMQLKFLETRFSDDDLSKVALVTDWVDKQAVRDTKSIVYGSRLTAGKACRARKQTWGSAHHGRRCQAQPPPQL